MSKKSMAFIAILYIVICVITVTSIAVLCNNETSKKITLCEELQNNMIYVTTYNSNIKDGIFKEKETIDLTKLSSLKLGKRISLTFSDDIEVHIMNPYSSGGGYRGFIITGLVHDDFDYYYVVDNIEIVFIKNGGIGPDIDPIPLD